MKKLTRILGVASIAALSLLAVTAAGAQAHMEIEAGGKVLTGTITAEALSAVTGQLLIPTQKALEIKCTSAKAKASGVNNNTSEPHDVKGTLLLLFHGCTLPNSPNCTIYPTEADAGTKTNKGLIHATANVLLGVLNGGNLYAVGTGLGSEKVFSTVYAGEEGGCTLPFESTVEGQAALRIINGSTSEKEHEVVDATAAQEVALGIEGLSYGEEPAEVDAGAAKAFLTGTHATMSYRLTP